MTEPLSSRSENEKRAYRRHLIATSSADELRIEVKRLDERLEAAEGERDAANRRITELGLALTRMVGERDRLREEGTHVEVVCGCKGREVIDEPCERHRAALSTGDRQDDDSHVRTAEATQPAQARHETGGGAS